MTGRVHADDRDELERLTARRDELKAVWEAKHAEALKAETAWGSAILDVMHLANQMEREGTLDPHWPWIESHVVRRVVAIEGRQTTDNRVIANGALTWPDAPVPIRPMNDLDGGLLGKATNFRREDDGTITADIDIRRPVADDEFFNPFVWITASHRDDGVLYLTSGRIGELTLQGPLHWPWSP